MMPAVKWELTLGNIIHIGVLVVGLAVAYGQFSQRFDWMARSIVKTQNQTTRIERYLSTKDSQYWRTIKDNNPDQ